MGATTATAYARAVERLLAERTDRAAVLSPRDWAILTGWHARGVPLELVEEALDAAVERQSRGKGAASRRGLSYLAPAVEEAWRVILDGRSSNEPAGPRVSDSRETAVDCWKRRLEQEPPESRLGLLLETLLDDHSRGAGPAALDSRLDESLPDAVPRDLLQRCEAEIERQIAPFRSRLSLRVLEQTITAARRQFLRRALGLPRADPHRPAPDDDDEDAPSPET